jgi:protoporphyrinogen oxidase
VERVDVLILGGGPTGLGAACRLSEHGEPQWLLCERASRIGGLSRSFADRTGFKWDLGGHVLASERATSTLPLSGALRGADLARFARKARAYAEGTWIPYPFQNNIHALPHRAFERCLRGLLEAHSRSGLSGSTNLFEFLDDAFGEGIAGIFMRPYNEKIWVCSSEDLSRDWVDERIAVPNPALLGANTLRNPKDEAWGVNSTFSYPRVGGIETIWRCVGSALPSQRVRTGRRAAAIDLRARQVAFTDGTTVGYEKLISTLPLDQTALMTGHRGLTELTSRLLHSSVQLLGFRFRPHAAAGLAGIHWAYFPAPEIPFYRISHVSSYNSDQPTSRADDARVLAEVAESAHNNAGLRVTATRVIEGFRDVGLVQTRADVALVWARRVEYAYPTPTTGRDEVLEDALNWLEKRGVLSRGRFGAWRYEVSDMCQSFMQGYEAAARVVSGESERTLWGRPDR